MILNLDKRLDAIFAAHQDVRQAELEGNRKRLRRRVLDGLSGSCLLLRDIGGDENLKKLRPTNEAFQSLKKIKDDGKLQDFLETERKLLYETHLDRKLVDQLVDAFRRVAMMEAMPSLEWENVFRQLTGPVCRGVETLAHSESVQPLLKRTLFAGGGFVVMVTNAAAVGLIGPVFAAGSAAAGWTVVVVAAQDQLKDWWK